MAGTPEVCLLARVNSTRRQRIHRRRSKAAAAAATAATEAPRAVTKPALIADSDWPPHHRSMLPVLLAMLTRVLPAVVIARGHGGTSNAAKRLQVIDEADRLALDHVPELAAIPVDKRHRYARSLLTAMIEDELITFRPEGSTAAADTARECLTPRR